MSGAAGEDAGCVTKELAEAGVKGADRGTAGDFLSRVIAKSVRWYTILWIDSLNDFISAGNGIVVLTPRRKEDKT